MYDSMKEEDRKYERSNNYCASFILFVCSLALIGILFIRSCASRVKYEHQVTFVVHCDSSVRNAPTVSTAVVDSLKEIIEHHERVLNDQYQSLVEKKEDDNDWLSMSSIIVGVVISVLGFFGFKNFQSIEEKAKSQAEDKTKQYLEENLKVMLHNSIQNNFLKTISDTAYDSVRDNVLKDVLPKADAMDSMKNGLEDMGKQINAIAQKIDRVKSQWEKKFNEELFVSDAEVIQDEAEQENEAHSDDELNPFAE